MQLHNLKPDTKRRAKKIVGRGGKRGKTSGRGGKGQTARAGHRVRPEIRDVIKKLPKLRGYSAPRIGKKLAVVNVEELEARLEDGSKITPGDFGHKRMKILGQGVLSKKITVEGFELSASARKKIGAAGGKIM